MNARALPYDLVAECSIIGVHPQTNGEAEGNGWTVPGLRRTLHHAEPPVRLCRLERSCGLNPAARRWCRMADHPIDHIVRAGVVGSRSTLGVRFHADSKSTGGSRIAMEPGYLQD